MVEVSIAASSKSGSGPRVAPSRPRRGPPSARRNVPTRKRIEPSKLALSEERRAWNRDRMGLASDLKCECTRPGCRGRVPAVAEKHRRANDQFVVAPAHFDGGVVVRAADRFFVVAMASLEGATVEGATGFPVAVGPRVLRPAIRVYL